MDRKKVCRGYALRIAVGITMLVLLLADGAGAATIAMDDSVQIIDASPHL